MSAAACVWRCLDLFPDPATLHALNPARYPHLLESVARSTAQARYDILFAFPGENLILDGQGRLSENGRAINGGFLEAFDARWCAAKRAVPTELPFPFHGGWFVFLGYELARFLEPTLAGMPADTRWPAALAVRFPAAVIRDHARRQTWLVCEAEHAALLAEMEHDVRGAGASLLPEELPALHALHEEDAELYRERIARVLAYVRAGETYQVNLSRVWSAQFAAAPAPTALYVRLRGANPAPFAGLATLGDQRVIVSSSPERLVRVCGRRISTRPIAGTFPRGQNAGQDRDLMRALVRHPKERAEHVMLVDLERNDLGRVCRPGSVRADELLTVETYRHVHHIVSNVTGELREGVTPAQVIRAVFPGGTITGCPKLRTMQIIAELEGEPRGGYTGSMGYINRDGSLDFNILIRTLMLDGNRLQLRAGGGIVADSNPERELHETRVKARGLLAALGISAGNA